MPVQCRSGSGPLESAQGSCPKIFPGERTALGRPSLRVRRAGELGQDLFPRLRLSLRNSGFATGSAAEMGFKFCWGRLEKGRSPPQYLYLRNRQTSLRGSSPIGYSCVEIGQYLDRVPVLTHITWRRCLGPPFDPCPRPSAPL